jgi:hypothetical protein
MSDPSASDLLERILQDPLNDRNLPALVEQIRTTAGVLPFVGAGLSIPLGFSGWTEFLKSEGRRNSLESEINRHLAAGGYEEAAELLSDRMGFTDFEDALEAEFGERKLVAAFPNEGAVMYVPKLTTGPVITTNFDRVLEKAFEISASPFVDKVWGARSDLLTLALVHNRRVLVKMHGDVLDRANRVLTLSQYKEQYGGDESIDFSRPLPNLLKRLFESRPVLFMGCSLNHDRTLKVLRKVASDANTRHFAIVERSAAEEELRVRRKYLSDHGIRVIWFPSGEFHSVSVLLRHLAELRADAQKSPIAETIAAPARWVAKGQGSGHTDSEDSSETAPRIKRDPKYWNDKAWDFSVHERLGETLVCYLVRIRPYDEQSVIEAFNKILSELGVASVRAFGIFGNYDLFIRAWLPASLPHRFEEALERKLPGVRGVYAFTVDKVEHRWYETPLPEPDRRTRMHLLNDLERQAIQDVESGNTVRFEELKRLNLAFERGVAGPPHIILFETIDFQDELSTQVIRSISEGIRDFLIRNSNKYRRPALDRGHGFCQFLIKAEVEDFFCIAELPNWISDEFREYGVMTETFLSQQPTHMTGSSKIGPATFEILEGRDLFAQSLIPELYPKKGSHYDEAERFLKGSIEAKKLGAGGKNFLRNFILAVLNEKPSDMVTAFFQLFYDWEAYLRDAHSEFLGRMGAAPGRIYKEVGIPVEKRYEEFTFVDVLQIYSRALRDRSEGKLIGTDWQQLTTVRNQTAHARIDPGHWQEPLKSVLQHWKRMHLLICLVERVTRRPFIGVYRDGCDDGSGLTNPGQ